MRVFEQKKPVLIDETLSIEEIKASDSIVKLLSIPRVYQLFIKPYHGVYIYSLQLKKRVRSYSKILFSKYLASTAIAFNIKGASSWGTSS